MGSARDDQTNFVRLGAGGLRDYPDNSDLRRTLGRGLIQADDCPPRSAHSAATRRFHFKIADRVAARKRGKNKPNVGMKTCEITDNG